MTTTTNPLAEAELLNAALDQLRSALPTGWSAHPGDVGPGDFVDGIFTVGPDDGPTATLVFEAKRLFRPRDVQYTIERLAQWVANNGNGELPTLIARYLSPSARARIIECGGNYLDATGNIRITAHSPPLFLQLSGLDSDPWRAPGRPRAGLSGDPAARVVRALVDVRPPYSVPELVGIAGSSTGATYRVVKFLEEEALIERDGGKIVAVDAPALLRRWAANYSFRNDERVRAYIDPRGSEATLERLARLDPHSYAITGSFAAQLDAPYAPPRLLTLHMRAPAAAVEELGFRPTDTGNNILIRLVDDPWPLQRSRFINGLSYAAVSQVIVDLFGLPGRSPEEAAELLRWMEAIDGRN